VQLALEHRQRGAQVGREVAQQWRGAGSVLNRKCGWICAAAKRVDRRSAAAWSASSRRRASICATRYSVSTHQPDNTAVSTASSSGMLSSTSARQPNFIAGRAIRLTPIPVP
jgi:hypothetical protein